MIYPCVLPYGDAAILVEFGDVIDRDLNARVMALDSKISELKLEGVLELMPSFRSLMIRFDPLVTDHKTLETVVLPFANSSVASQRTGRSWCLPVCYEPEFAIDLDEISQRSGLSEDQIISKHSEIVHHVYMIGFLPGHPYLGDLPQELYLPRRADPRQRVVRGSVAIAVGMTAIYPVDSPGGWNIVGRTPVPLFNFDLAIPSLLAPGDKLEFSPVNRKEFDRLEIAIAAGEWRADQEALK